MSSAREPSYGIVPLQKIPGTSPPVIPNMRMTVNSDGSTCYMPAAASVPYQASGGGGGSEGGAAGTMIAQHGLNMNMGEPLRRKRGRPRKYGPDGTMALALSPVSPAIPTSGGFSSTPTQSPAMQLTASPSEMKKARGRPPGSGNKQNLSVLGIIGVTGNGFTPHVITVKAGEDVSSKILSISQHGPRAVCILSANGAISNVTIRQAATSGGTVTYEGRFEILSLSGSFTVLESGGHRSRTGGLSVTLAGPDGRVLGGGVAGLLTAASPVQVVVGSFILDAPKESKPMNLSGPPSAPTRLTPGSACPGSPPSRGTLSESSGGPGSPLNQSTGACNNSNPQGMANMPWK
eukprot:TRINITY_DN1993_c2_g1_i1.p1 TRINITY_DN1993_c2_g1~~TRINITY_DN1993_c2_g1_i1.p1  ORF type:complete len:348 (-),score=32.20 TRINITY_DN1993_c2_g1_i1:235-1278(-)